MERIRIRLRIRVTAGKVSVVRAAFIWARGVLLANNRPPRE